MDIEHFSDLVSYLRKHGFIKINENPSCKILTGGVSNRTILVSREQSKGFIVKQVLTKLNVKEDWFSPPERIFVEARALEVLTNLIPKGCSPELIFEDRDQFLLIMEAIPQPHENWKSLLLRGIVRFDHVDQFARLLAAIHGQTNHNNFYARLFSEKKFFESLRLDAYYHFASEHVPEAREFLHRLSIETSKEDICLVHGDFSPKNVLIHKYKLVLLDFEVMHYGDGAFDLGFALTHFLSKANHLKESRGEFIKAAQRFWASYNLIRNVDPKMEERAVRHTLGCLLSRVKGKSPLEYLSDKERASQLEICLKILPELPMNMNHFIDLWERTSDD